MEHKGECAKGYLAKAKTIIDDYDEQLKIYHKQKDALRRVKKSKDKSKKKSLKEDLKISKAKLKEQSKEYSRAIKKAKINHKIDTLDLNSLSKKRKMLKRWFYEKDN